MSFYGIALTFILLAVMVELSFFAGLMANINSINTDYYKSGSLILVGVEAEMANSGVPTQYLNFTSGIGGMQITNQNGSYLIEGIGSRYLVTLG